MFAMVKYNKRLEKWVVVMESKAYAEYEAKTKVDAVFYAKECLEGVNEVLVEKKNGTMDRVYKKNQYGVWK